MFSVYLVYKLKLDFTCLCFFITNQTVESHIEVVVRSKEGDGKPQTGVLSASDHCLNALGNLNHRSERAYHILQLAARPVVPKSTSVKTLATDMG